MALDQKKKKIKNLISKLKLKKKVKLFNQIQRKKVLEELSKSDIYLFPSLREGGSWALMEAMAIGLPVICLNWSGMQIIANDSSAIMIPVTDPSQMPSDFAKAISTLLESSKLRKRIGASARSRIKDKFSWDSKGEFLQNLLDNLDIKK